MPPLTMLITWSWNRPETRTRGTQAFTIVPKEPYPLRGYLGLHGWGECQGWPDMMLMTLFFLCAADQRTCCDNCVSSEYPWHQPLIVSVFYICIGASQSTVSRWELNTKLAVMFMVEEGAWGIPWDTLLSLFCSHSFITLNAERKIY